MLHALITYPRFLPLPMLLKKKQNLCWRQILKPSMMALLLKEFKSTQSATSRTVKSFTNSSPDYTRYVQSIQEEKAANIASKESSGASSRIYPGLSASGQNFFTKQTEQEALYYGRIASENRRRVLAAQKEQEQAAAKAESFYNSPAGPNSRDFYKFQE